MSRDSFNWAGVPLLFFRGDTRSKSNFFIQSVNQLPLKSTHLVKLLIISMFPFPIIPIFNFQSNFCQFCPIQSFLSNWIFSNFIISILVLFNSVLTNIFQSNAFQKKLLNLSYPILINSILIISILINPNLSDRIFSVPILLKFFLSKWCISYLPILSNPVPSYLKDSFIFLLWLIFCQAQFQLASSVPVKNLNGW